MKGSVFPFFTFINPAVGKFAIKEKLIYLKCICDKLFDFVLHSCTPTVDFQLAVCMCCVSVYVGAVSMTRPT